MDNVPNQESSPSCLKDSHQSSLNSTQNPSFSQTEAHKMDSFSEEKNATFIKAKQILYPSFFSTEGLAQDILKVTEAEADVPMNVFIRLFPLRANSVLKDSLTNLFGTGVKMGILHSPEHLMGDQNIIQLPKKLLKRDNKVFERLEEVIRTIDDFAVRITNLDGLQEKEGILKLLQNVGAFYNGYKTKILQICEKIRQNLPNIADNYDELERLLKPKATMFGELLSEGPAYRISREKARHILSLDSHQASLPKDPNASANHQVSYLPYHEDHEIKQNPLVFFKSNGRPPLQPGKEAMLSSLYRLLNIPVPQTGFLVLTGLHENNPNFYPIQASEAVKGKSPKDDHSWREEEELIKLEAFCQQAVGAILTNPSDGKAANFIHHKEKYGLVSIDNDEVFYDDFVKDNNDFLIQTKSLLFCLKAMDKPIPRSLTNFLTTLDIELLLLTWLNELDQKNREYQFLMSVLSFENARQIFQKTLPHEEHHPIEELLERPVEFYGLNATPFFDEFSLPITVPIGLLNSLKSKLVQIAKVLSEPVNSEMTSQKLLEQISPQLGVYYRKLREKFPDPLDAMDAIWHKGFDLASSVMDDISNIKMQDSDDGNIWLPKDLYSELFQNFKSSNPYSLDRFIHKYGERRIKGQLQPEDALKEMLCLLKLDLAESQNARDVVDFCFKGREQIKDGSLVQSEWDNLFFSLSGLEFKWLFAIEKYFPRGWKKTKGNFPESVSEIKGILMKSRHLSQEILSEILDESGKFKEEKSLPGRSQVAKFPKMNPLFYFKKTPEIPGYEYAAALLMKSLGLEGIPFSDLLLFKDPKKGLYSVLLTQGVQGDPLDVIGKDDNALTSLDPHHTFLLILCSILLNPEDGKGDNYIVSSDRKRIIPIDQDHVFLPGVIHERNWFFTVQTELQSKTVLYCLHEMNKPVPPSVAKIFTELDVDQFLDNWLNKLVTVNDSYQNFPPKDLLVKEGKEGTFFRIAFQMDSIKNLYTKLSRMKQLLSEQSNITPFDLLKSTEPYVWQLYQRVFHEEKTVLGRFTKLTADLYEKDKNGHQMSRLTSIQIFKILDIPKSELLGQNLDCQWSPHNVLELLKKYREEMKQKESTFQKIIRGEIELQKIDLGGYSKSREESTFKEAFQKNQEALALHKSKFLDVEILLEIFGSFSLTTGTEIRLLDLRGTQKLNNFCIQVIASYIPNIEFLHLGSHPSLNSAMFLGGNFKRMKRLVVSNCPNLSGLVVESSLLDVLQIQNNPKLHNALLKTPNLTYFDFTGSNETIKIYMFDSIKTLQTVKPDFGEMKEATRKIVNLEAVIQNEMDRTIEYISMDITRDQCMISGKNKMPRNPDALSSGPIIAMHQLFLKTLSFYSDNSYEKTVVKLQPKTKKLISKLIEEAFDQKG